MVGDDWPAWCLHTVIALVTLSGAMGLAQSIWCSDGESSGSERDGVKITAHPKRAAFRAFQLQYLAVYLLIMLADWLQGTHMYTLYTSYGFAGADVGTLFVTGFTSSLIFGTFLGLYVDKYGRKLGCIVFCVLEVIINTMEVRLCATFDLPPSPHAHTTRTLHPPPRPNRRTVAVRTLRLPPDRKHPPLLLLFVGQ